MKCPRCNSSNIETIDNNINVGKVYRCYNCELEWDNSTSSILRQHFFFSNCFYHCPLELKEHTKFMKDGQKLTQEVITDILIDLWLFGKGVR